MTLNQFMTRSSFLPLLLYSQTSKPGRIAAFTKNERATRFTGNNLIVQSVFEGNAILLIVGVGIVSVIAFRVITAIQGSEFTIHMAWDVIYGWVGLGKGCSCLFG